MKKLIFVRHGLAESHGSVPNDFCRSLTSKGKATSLRMAERLAAKEAGRMVVISSPAFRAIETALIFSSRLKGSFDDILIREAIYGLFGRESLFSLLNSLDDKKDTVILFGHNPSFTSLVSSFLEGGDLFVPNSGVACLLFESDRWNDISGSRCSLSFFLTPDDSD